MLRRGMIFFFLLLVFNNRNAHSSQRVDTTGRVMQKVIVSKDKKDFRLQATGEIFHPWGMNYGHYDVITKDRNAPVWDTVRSDFEKMKRMGGNSVRITLEYDLVMQSPTDANPQALQGFRHLIELAHKVGLYIDVTGLAEYRPTARKQWYDTLSEKERWETQMAFWRIVAETGKSDPAIFCYDLINEPVIKGNPEDTSWYTGHLGKYDFCQYLSLYPAGRSKREIAYEWTKKMTEAIRGKDPQTLITIGFATWSNAVFDTVEPLLDFMCAHIYPESEDLEKADRQLKFYEVGKPILVEETFPLRCDTAELANFMRKSKRVVSGWFGHYLMPYSLKEMKKMKHLTIKEAIYKNWLELFVSMGKEMK